MCGERTPGGAGVTERKATYQAVDSDGQEVEPEVPPPTAEQFMAVAKEQLRPEKFAMLLRLAAERRSS